MKTNKIKILLAIFALSILSLSCEDYLDKEPTDEKSEEEVYTRYSEVNGLVSHAYNRAKYANRPIVYLEHFSSAAITDECEGTNVEGNITNLYNQGSWNQNENFPGNTLQFWSSIYETIRHINLTLDGIERYQTPDNPLNPGDIERRVGELYFLRAYFHYCLLRNYGEIPYVDYLVDPNGDLDFEVESAHAVIDKIVDDCNRAYELVQDNYGLNDVNFGRVTKGACLGLKSIALWMAATPLYNGASEKGYTGTRVFENEYSYDANRWVLARDAAKAVIDFEVDGVRRFSLYSEYGSSNFEDDGGRNLNGSLVYTRLWDMFHDKDAYYAEGVWFVTRDKDQAWQGDNYSPSRGGSSRQQPVQEQVDEYEYMAPDGFGYPIYSQEARNAGYDDQNPYINRDPRFYRDIIYHGAPYRDNANNATTLNTAEGQDAINASNATITGYYHRKFFKEGWNKSGGFQVNGAPIFRLPEFIYIYAEAVNELNGPNSEIYDMINAVRERSFVNPMPITVQSNKELMFEYIQRERRVEFYYENKRPWNCRLYLEPSNSEELHKEQLFYNSGSNNSERSINYWANNYGAYPKCQRLINGMRPIEDPNGDIVVDGKTYKMERFCIEERIFDTPKHYYWPIMNTELQVSPTLVQKPGW